MHDYGKASLKNKFFTAISDGFLLIYLLTGVIDYLSRLISS